MVGHSQFDSKEYNMRSVTLNAAWNNEVHVHHYTDETQVNLINVNVHVQCTSVCASSGC